jgi:DNA-binding transcriptional LysR family regulator
MELRHLRYFVAVAEEQNVTRAAARLHVSQPPVSRQIRDLENEIGVALFEHGAKSLRLTDAGRVFLDEAKAVLKRASESVEMAKAVGDGKRGEIRVGYAPSLTAQLLPRVLRFFQETNPQVRVQLHDLSSQDMLRGVQDGWLHLGWMVRPSENSLKGLDFVEASRHSVCVAMPLGHRLAQTRKIGIAQIIDENLLAFTRADYPENHEWLAQLFKPFGREPAITEEHESSASLIAALEAGRGIALVLEGFDCLVGQRLKVRKLVPPPASYVVGLVRRVNDASNTAKSFLAAVKRAGRVRD